MMNFPDHPAIVLSFLAVEMVDYRDFTANEAVGEESKFTVKLGSWRVVCTNGIVNLCFLALYASLQFNACMLFEKRGYVTFTTGFVLFVLATGMEALLIIQPPQLMKWIPFWNNSFGRGTFLCIASVMSLNGYFLAGFASLLASFVVTVSAAFTGTYEVAVPILNYSAIFESSGPTHVSCGSAVRAGKVRDSDVAAAYQRIPDCGEE